MTRLSSKNACSIVEAIQENSRHINVHGANKRNTRTKFSSIKNTQKITHAMELVAASKMRKAQDRMATSRPYANKIRQVIRHVAQQSAEYHHPYLEARRN